MLCTKYASSCNNGGFNIQNSYRTDGQIKLQNNNLNTQLHQFKSRICAINSVRKYHQLTTQRNYTTKTIYSRNYLCRLLRSLPTENESVPKIIVNNTINLFFKLQSAFCKFESITVFKCCMIKLLPYILFEKIYIYSSALEMASPGNQHCANCIGTLSFPTETRKLKFRIILASFRKGLTSVR